MRQFRILYRWQSREYVTITSGRSASHAIMLAQVVQGGQVFGVESVN